MKLTCPVTDCPNVRPVDHAMCRPCWSRLTRDLQQAIYRAGRERLRGYQGARGRHLQAVENACAHIEHREPRDLLLEDAA